jgi:hypothetical protein
VVVLVAVALVVLRPLAALQLLGKVMRVVVRLAVDQIITVVVAVEPEPQGRLVLTASVPAGMDYLHLSQALPLLMRAVVAAATMVQLIHQLDQPEVLVVAVKAVHPAMKPEKMEQATPAVAAAAVLTLMV